MRLLKLLLFYLANKIKPFFPSPSLAEHDQLIKEMDTAITDMQLIRDVLLTKFHDVGVLQK